MADLVNLRMVGDRAFIDGSFFDEAQAKALIRDAVDDMADAIETEAKRQAPQGPTGKLKLHPVDREDGVFGIVSTGPAFGGQRSIQGVGGRFVGAVPVDTSVGQTIARSIITVAEKPYWAKYVHDGTGVYGPTGNPITARDPEGFMVFHKSRWPTARILIRTHYRFKEVKGQKAQPYLDEAFLVVNRTIVPQRIQLLEAQIEAIT